MWVGPEGFPRQPNRRQTVQGSAKDLWEESQERRRIRNEMAREHAGWGF
jgi:hypothetical protein